MQHAARSAVLYRHDGELPVGVADIVSTGHRSIPCLIVAPTMRVPMQLPPDTVNPYLAARAVLRLIEQVDDIHAVVAALAGAGVDLLRYGGMDQDGAGVWTTPGGDRVAWFKDPDGNTLSLTQFAPR